MAFWYNPIAVILHDCAGTALGPLSQCPTNLTPNADGVEQEPVLIGWKSGAGACFRPA